MDFYYNGNRMQDGTLRSYKPNSPFEEKGWIKSGYIKVDDYCGEFDIDDVVEPDEQAEENEVVIDWANLTVDQTTMKLLKAKAKELEIKVPKKCNEAKLLELIQDSIGG